MGFAPTTIKELEKQKLEKSILKQMSKYREICPDSIAENFKGLGISQKTLDLIFNGEIDENEISKDTRKYDYAIKTFSAALEKKMLVEAMGYDYKEVREYLKNIGGEGDKEKWIKTQKMVHKKHQPANATLFMFFMTNKFPEFWKISSELTTKKIEGYDSDPGQRNRKQVESIARQILGINPTQSSGKPELQG